MIIFKTLEYRNFMSVGNSPITINFSTSGSLLITGKNGHGKSTVVDALCFALFGVAYRDIKKGQLINSVNQKQCEVKLDFTVGSQEFRIIRGIKPNVFEIWKGEELINQESATRDYQKYLEKHILKFNIKTFGQAIALGSTAFLSFMKLPAAARREVIEEILDIKIFSSMTKLNKEKLDETKQQLNTIEGEIIGLASKIATQEKLISRFQEIKQEAVGNLHAEITKVKEDLELHKERFEKITERRQKLYDKLLDPSTQGVITADGKLGMKIIDNIFAVKTADKAIEDYENNKVCSLCGQGTEHLHSEDALKKLINARDELLEKRKVLTAKQNELKEYVDAIAELEAKIAKYTSELSPIELQINFLNGRLRELDRKLNELSLNNTNVDAEKLLLKQYTLEEIDLTSKKNELINLRDVQMNMALLLKDGGIKTSIIKEYLPIMNQTINKYLEELDFFVRFELDENFTEVIKSRHRDEFSYASFSEGEKQRIDLAILLAWVYIAKLKNSVNTNLLFMDEVLSGNLDDDGVELFMNMVESLKTNINIILVSHNNAGMIDRFDKVIKIEKVGNFSQIA